MKIYIILHKRGNDVIIAYLSECSSMVEHHVANVVVAGSSPVTRSIDFMRKYILTAFGKDRPGIVASITEILYQKGANIEDSSMSRLSDQFVIMLLFTSENPIAKEEFRLEDIEVYINQVEDENITKPSNCSVIISIYGADKTGIVYKVSKLLASKDINIKDLRTHKLKDIYIMLMEADLKDVSLSSLEKSLKDLSKELNVDISLQEVCKEIL